MTEVVRLTLVQRPTSTYHENAKYVLPMEAMRALGKTSAAHINLLLVFYND